MQINSFEDIFAWQKARILSLNLYKQFKTVKDYSFRDQLLRAAISIGNNIAEGFERRSNKELKQFLFIAKGSCGEVRSMLYTAKDIEHVSKEDFESDCLLATEISKLLSGFIKTL